MAIHHFQSTGWTIPGECGSIPLVIADVYPQQRDELPTSNAENMECIHVSSPHKEHVVSLLFSKISIRVYGSTPTMIIGWKDEPR